MDKKYTTSEFTLSEEIVTKVGIRKEIHFRSQGEIIRIKEAIY